MYENQKSYKDAGVDIQLGDNSSIILYEASKKTWINRKEIPGEVFLSFDSFSSLRFLKSNQFPDAIIGLNFDGIGTKIEIAERMNIHTTVAYDLFAMVCDDAARTGGEPIVIGSILDFNKISPAIVTQLAEGMVAASKVANVAVINGELAELGNRVSGYGSNSYNWGAAVVWLGLSERMLAGNTIQQGDSIIAFREKGFRSNGLSLVRIILQEEYGDKWHNESFENSRIGEFVLEPSIIYTPIITTLTGGYCKSPTAKIHGVIHVTGGGIPGKLERILRETDFGAELENLFEPPKIMHHCQELGNTSDREAYKTWNMGNGLLIISPEPDKVIYEANNLGYEAVIAGKITSNKTIIIGNRGLKEKKEHFLEYDL